MSAAQKLMADVLAAHRWSPAKDDARGGCFGCAYHGDYTGWVAHITPEIDEALGGLTQERRDADDCDCGNEAHPSWCDDDCVRFDPDKAKVRWVSGWSEVQS